MCRKKEFSNSEKSKLFNIADKIVNELRKISHDL
jgi:hypothetical protein